MERRRTGNCTAFAPYRVRPFEFAPTLCRVRPHTFRVRPHQVEFAPWLSDIQMSWFVTKALAEVALSAFLKPYTLLVCCLRYFLIIFVLQHSICHFWFIFAFLVRKNLLKVNDSKAAGPSIKHPRDPSHSKISIHILNTVLYTFPIVLTKRICLAIKSFFIWWSFPFFSWP